MSRYLRYLLIWLSCTAAGVTSVLLTIHVVVGSTKPTPPVARSAPTVFSSPSEHGRSKARKASTPRPSATATPARPSPKPTATRTSARPSTPAAPSGTAPASGTQAGTGDFTDCDGGAGVHTIDSAGGQASVRFGDRGVCLVSAVPTRGFTVRTSQTEPTELSVTFTGDRRESVITATSEPEGRATVRETSW